MMNPRKVVIVDCNAVCYAAYYTAGNLSYGGQDTGIIYSFFSQIQHVCKAVQAAHVAFCWDSRQSRRKLLFPEYKSNRKKDDPQLLRALGQFKRLRKDVLPRLNFRNCFHCTGFEADDLIASLCLHDAPTEDVEYIILSGDQDLYQLLSPRVSMYKLGKSGRRYTLADFMQEFGIPVSRWSEVKAIAGCTSDAIRGIPGIGEKRAIQFYQGKCPVVWCDKIKSIEGLRIRRRNRPLVTLPLEGTPELHFDWSKKPSFAEWISLCEELGFSSFLRRMADWESIFSGMPPQDLFCNKVRIGR